MVQSRDSDGKQFNIRCEIQQLLEKNRVIAMSDRLVR